MVYTGWLVTCLGFVSAATVWFERSVRVSDVTGYVVLDIAGLVDVGVLLVIGCVGTVQAGMSRGLCGMRSGDGSGWSRSSSSACVVLLLIGIELTGLVWLLGLMVYGGGLGVVALFGLLLLEDIHGSGADVWVGAEAAVRISRSSWAAAVWGWAGAGFERVGI
jgi:hypothetical protein